MCVYRNVILFTLIVLIGHIILRQQLQNTSLSSSSLLNNQTTQSSNIVDLPFPQPERIITTGTMTNGYQPTDRYAELYNYVYDDTTSKTSLDNMYVIDKKEFNEMTTDPMIKCGRDDMTQSYCQTTPSVRSSIKQHVKTVDTQPNIMPPQQDKTVVLLSGLDKQEGLLGFDKDEPINFSFI